MRHSKRHLPAAVSTVLGLAAPAVAAVLLASPTPGLAATPTPAVSAAAFSDGARDAAPLAQPKPAVKVVAKKAAATPAVRRTVAAPATKAVAKPVSSTVRRTTSTNSTRKTSTTSQTAQPWGVDDYKWKNQSDFYAIDDYGFTERQCVSFAAWRLAQHGHRITNDDNWGSALHWDETARSLGHAVTTKAHVGAIAQWNANESSPYYSKGSAKPNGHFTAGGYGHVGWVKQVYADGSALVEQYNMGGDRAYSVMRVKAPRYIVF